MKHLLLLLLLLSLPAAATWTNGTEVQSLTRSAPTESTDGVALLSSGGAPVRGYMVSVCAATGETLSGGGFLRAWVYSPLAGEWMRNEDLDLEVKAKVAGKKCRAWPDERVGYLRNRRVLYALDGLLVSGGTTGTVRIEVDTTL